MVMLLFFANLLISSWNVYSLGKSWVETRHAGGMASFLAVLAAGITGLCLTWNMLMIEARLANTIGLLSPAYPLALERLAIGVVALNGVLALLLTQSGNWAESYRHSLLSTEEGFQLTSYIGLRSSYHAVDSLHGALQGAVEVLFSDDDGFKTILIVLAICLTVLAGFVLVAAGLWFFAGRGEISLEGALPQSATWK